MKQVVNKKNNLIIPDTGPQEPQMMPVPQPPMPLSVTLEDSLLSAGLFYLDGEFRNEKIIPICKSITALNMLPESQQPEVITLMINSPGGEVASCFQLLDTMKASRIPVSTVAMGLAASCGIVTLLSGARGLRYASSTAMIMSHQFSAGSGGKFHELMASSAHFEVLNSQMVDIYKKHTKKSEAYIKKNLLGPTDVWMDAETALSHGIIDGIMV